MNYELRCPKCRKKSMYSPEEREYKTIRCHYCGYRFKVALLVEKGAEYTKGRDGVIRRVRKQQVPGYRVQGKVYTGMSRNQKRNLRKKLRSK